METRRISFLGSVRGRLNLAFLGISMFTLVAGGAGLLAVSRVHVALQRITEESVPQALALVEIARQADRILRAAPALLVATSDTARAAVAEVVNAEIDIMKSRLADVAAESALATASVAGVRTQVARLDQNLRELDSLVSQRLEITRMRETLMRNLQTAMSGAQRLMAPSERLLGAQVTSWNRLEGDTATRMTQERFRLAETIVGILPQREMSAKISAIGSLLSRIATSDSAEEVDVLVFGFQTALNDLRSMIAEMPGPIQSRLVRFHDSLLDLGDGDTGLSEIRKLELAAIQAGAELLQANTDLSSQLSENINYLVNQANDQIASARNMANSAHAFGFNILIAAAVLSLVSSSLIVWRYVNGSILARITGLTESMTAIAEGDLHASLPPTADGDEIALMAAALKVFRDTAAELRESNLLEIRTARQRLQEAIACLSQGFALFDKEGNLLTSNARYSTIMLGNEHNLVEGTPFTQIAKAAAESGRFFSARNDPERWQRDLVARFHSGEDTSNEQFDGDQWSQISIRSAPEVGTVVLLSDITEIQRISEELGRAKDEAEAANQAKSTFLASMSHEIRTPLNGIMGMAKLLQGTKLSDEQRDFSSTISEAADTLLAIINDILDFSKVEAGAMEIEQVPVNVVETIESAVELLASKASQKEIEFACRIYKDVPAGIIGDSVRLKQILLNLLNNAIKFTERGEVELSVDAIRQSDGSGQLQITIRDTGIGIPPDRMDRLFKSFSQVDASTTRRFGGTGLGLAITQRLVVLMGGTITVSSTVNVGTVFAVRLPYQVADVPVAYPDESLPELFASWRILVVDDNETNLTILADRLSGWGILPECTDHPDKAVALLREGHKFNAIITDFKMPGRTGIHMAIDIRQEFGNAAPPMLLYSSVTLMDANLRRNFEAAGFRAHLAKPARTQHLLRALINLRDPEAVPQKRTHADLLGDWSSLNQHLEILLVDDNPMNRKIGGKILERLGFAPVHASSGAEALRVISQRSFDVVLMDIEMPDMDGVTATGLLRSQCLGGNAPYIVALTANAMVTDRDIYLRSGMDDYLSKPIDVELLKNCLMRAQAQMRRIKSH